MNNSLIATVKEIIIEAEKRFPYVCATFFNNRGIEIRIDKKDEKVSASPSNLGFVLSLFNGEYFQEFATDKIEKDFLVKFCRKAIADTQPKQIKYYITPGRKCHKLYKTKEKVNPDRLSLTEKIAMLRQHREQILKGDKVVNGIASYSEQLNTKVFINRNRTISEEIRRVFQILIAYASDGKETKSNYLSLGGTGGMELLKVTNEEIDELVDIARRLLYAEKVLPNFYDVVVTPEIAGLIAHEAFGHGVETDMYLKNRACSKDYLGQMIASPIVNIIDDPTIPGAFGSYFIDDEGEIAHPTYIIKNGKFVQGLTDIYSRSVLKLPKTANGRRESFQRKIYTRMSNTFFKSGENSLEEVIASVNNGIYLIKGLSGMEDPKGWGIQVIVLYGKEIKNGKITNRIFSPLGITGYVPDLLKNITMVGNDFETDIGFCGKGRKEYVPVSSGGPHIRARVRLG